jgi:hypothetical protein
MSEIKIEQLIGGPYRFTKTTDYRCPQCDRYALKDHMPPSYSHFAAGMGHHESHSSQRCVCTHCKIAFQISRYEKREGNEITSKETPMEIVPLVKRNGVWLTPYDVRNQAYYDEHGEWPVYEYG